MSTSSNLVRQSGLTWVDTNSTPECTNRCVESHYQVRHQPAPTQSDNPYSYLHGAELDAKINETVEWWLNKQGLTHEQAL